MIYLLFFLSGFSALVYEITWARKLSLIFGTDAYGIATILAVFFAGLALGSYLYTRISTHWKRKYTNTIFLYAVVELGIGIYALFSPLIFELIKFFQAGFWRVFTPTFGTFNLFTFILSVAALIIPTTLMGATLPAIVAAIDKNKVGLLYGLNTLGAFLGVIAAGFLLISSIGVNETIWLAAVVNLLIGATAVYLSRMKANERIDSHIRSNSFEIRSHSRLILVSYALSGFAAIGLEVLFTRVLILVIGGSIFAFTIVLSVFLAGIALGSSVGSKLFSRSQNYLKTYAILQFVLGISVIFSLPLLSNLPFSFLSVFRRFGSNFTSLQFGLFLLSVMVIFLPTFIMGLVFPVVVKAYEASSKEIGVIYAGNTIGGVLGSLVTGFILIPILGTANSIVIMAAIYLAIGAGFIYSTSVQNVVKFSFSIMLAVSIFFGINFARWNTKLLTAGLYVEPDEFKGMDKKQILKKIKKSPVLFEKEGISSLITVKKDTDGNINLQINGKTDASTGSDMENQVLLGQLPLLLHPNPKEVLVVGLGSGITLGSVLSHEIEKVDVVEIEKEVVEAAKFFEKYNNKALKDKRVRLIVADGRNYLLASDKKYDVISSEPSNPWLSGSSKLFTREYFQQLKKALEEDGIVIHWVNMYAIGIKGLASVINAFVEVFPQAAAFGIPVSNDLLLVGSNKPIKIDSEILEKKLKNKNVFGDLKKASIERPFEILAKFYLDKDTLRKVAKGGNINTDNVPFLEFQAPKRLYYEVSENPWRLLHDNLTPISQIAVNSPKEDLQKAQEFRKSRILARIYYIEKNIGEGKKYAEAALNLDPDNPNLKSNLARYYFEEATSFFNSKSYLKAAELYGKSLEYKKTPEAYFNLGQSWEDTDPLKAKEAFEKAALLDPDFVEALDRLGSLYLEEGNLNSALDTFRKLDKLEPNKVETVVSLAQLYFLKQDFGRAESYAQKALKIDPINKEAKEILEKLP